MIGYLPSDRLKFVQDEGARFYDSSQPQQVVFSGTQTEVAKLWSAAVACGMEINGKNIPYPFIGLFGGLNGANSNSVATTLLKCMGIDNGYANLPGNSPAEKIILLTPQEINSARASVGIVAAAEANLKRDVAVLSSSSDYHGFNFSISNFSSTSIEEWELSGHYRNEGFFSVDYEGSGLSLNIDNPYIDILSFSDLEIIGNGNDIEFLDHVEVAVEGDDNVIDAKDYHTVVVAGQYNEINLYGLNGSVYANAWQVPYAPQSSIYDTAQNIIYGYYFLLYGNDNKHETRTPVFPDPNTAKKPDEQYSNQNEHAKIVGLFELEPI